MSDLLFRAELPPPWSAPVAGPAALAAVAGLLVLLTLWGYARRPEASRRRVAVLVALRLLALLLALVTVARPSVGVQENPKVPSVLVIGVDQSESMAVPDEVAGQARLDAVKRTLERCQPTLDALKADQNVEVAVLGFGDSDFRPDAAAFDPARPADRPRSDYGAFLRRVAERYQAEPYVRAVVVVGDGIDNGPTKPDADAAKLRQAGRAVQTFAVGYATSGDTKDVALVSLMPTTGTADGAVYVKTDFTLRVVANAFGFTGARVPVKVQFADAGGEYKDVKQEDTTLTAETDNAIDIKLKAPDRPGQIKVRVEIPPAAVVGDVAPANNAIETYLTVAKEGLRVLVVNRASVEQAAIRRALAGPDTRMDVYQVIRQTEDPATPQERNDFDFDRQAYDVIVVGNVSARQLTTLDPAIPGKIRDQVLNKGVGLLMTGGHATLGGDPAYPDATGWAGTPEFADLLPVDLTRPGPVPARVFADPVARFQSLPTVGNDGFYLNRVADTPAASNALWGRLNDPASRSRLTGVNALGRVKPNATVYAVADPAPGASAVPAVPAAGLPPLLVAHQVGAGDRGRVLVFAGQDSYLWQTLGQPATKDGVQLHARFWRQMVRWCAHQEEDDGQVYARPELPRLPVGGKQTVRIGVRQPGGAPALNPQFPVVKILAPGEDEKAAPNRPYLPAEAGGFRVPFEPTVPGEYTVKVTGTGQDAKGGAVTGEAVARFLVYAQATDEALVKAARPDILQRLAAAGGGQARRLDELPAFLTELASTPLDAAKPKPKFYPDWRRDRDGGFLPGWMVLFALVLACEWGLRRYWGLV